MMQLESLANELLLDLFELLDTVHLVHAFFGLNSRFDQLLYIHFQTHQLNFESISKEDFDVICEYHLSLMIDKLNSLRLSNYETPNLPELLLSRGFTLDRFIHLQSLSLHDIYSLDTLTKITFHCRSLPHLTHLNITKYDDEDRQRDILDLLENIWHIPSLTHCNLNGIQTDERSLSKISTISLSIKHLSVENIPCNLNCLYNLFQCTPRLQRLCSTVYSYSVDDHLILTIPSMKSMKLSFGGIDTSLKNLFEKMPNLYHLTIQTSQICLNGNVWEQIIINHLPNIQIFRLKMEFEFRENDDDMEDNVDKLLATFRSPFWLEKHRWFVRCHWNSSDPYRRVILYTLPYAFKIIHYSNDYCSKSTCFNEDEYWLYDHVQLLCNGNIEKNLFDKINFSGARFPNVRHLIINLPFDDNFWFRSLLLNHLTSLNVSLYKEFGYIQLQTLFDRAPNLYSLKLESFLESHTELFQLTSKSIRRLDFLKTLLNYSKFFTKEDCANLIKSPLGRQCEVLLIRINNRSNVLDLIQKMINLRLIIIDCRDGESIISRFSYTNIELVLWLQKHLSSTNLIVSDSARTFNIQVWVDQQRKNISSSNSFILTSKSESRFSQFFTLVRQFFS